MARTFTITQEGESRGFALATGVGPVGPVGPIGATGATGADSIVEGPAGPANTLSIASVTTGAAGSAASVTVGGTSPAQTLTFSIPQGLKGDTGDIGAPGPQGLKGDTGDIGATGATGATGAAGDTSIIPLADVSTTTRTVTPADAGYKLRLTHASGCALTIQPHATAAWTVGQIVYFRRTTGAGAPTWNNTGITLLGDGITGVLEGEEFALQNIAADTFEFI